MDLIFLELIEGHESWFIFGYLKPSYYRRTWPFHVCFPFPLCDDVIFI